MGALFNPDSPLMDGLNQLLDLVLLSLLWLIFSIPIVTMGASTTALYYTVTKVIRYRRGYPAREFWSAFKSNLKQSTLVWLFLLLLAAALSFDRALCGQSEAAIQSFLGYVFGILELLAAAYGLYALAYIARFKQTLRGIFLNSLLLMLINLPWTLLLLVILAAGVFAVWLLPIAIVLVPGICALLAGLVLEHIFGKVMTPEDRQAEEMRNHPERFDDYGRRFAEAEEAEKRTAETKPQIPEERQVFEQTENNDARF